MPRSTFSINSLQSAAPGLSRLAASLGGGDAAFQEGYDREGLAQTRMGQALAAMAASQAQADASRAKASQDTAETSVLQSRPDLYEEQVANAAGTTVPMVRAYRQRLRTGEAPQVPMGPETADGQMGVGSMQFDPAAGSKITQALTQFMPLLANVKDMKPDDLARAASIYGDTALRDQVLAGTVGPGALGAAQAARDGKPMYHAGENGAVLDLFGGALDTGNPVAQAFLSLQGAKTGAERASAAERYAGARAHDASAGKSRAETDQMRNAPKGVIVQSDSGPVLANPYTGQSIPLTGPDGKPVQGKGGTLNGEQANALTFASRMQAAQDILENLSSKGVMRPSIGKMVANAVPDWALGGIAQTSANMAQSAEQQQVEQAQRDFINAVLRRESGAAISMGEFRNAGQQYFPQPGDTPQVIAQKQQARQRVINGMLAAVPPNLRTIPDGPPSRQAAPTGQAGRNLVVDY